VQRAVRAAFEEATGASSPTWAIDGCSLPNFACTVRGLATAMARFATGEGPRGAAMTRLRRAMTAHPELVAGEGRACTALMRAMEGVAVKTGAEGVFVAILPAQGLGVALKIVDGASRASECTVAAVLARLGALPPDHPLVAPTLRNWRGLVTGSIRPAPSLSG
jgi:L-asparaginase II